MVVDYDPDNAALAETDWQRLISGGIEASCLIAMVDGEIAGFAHTLVHDFVFRRRPAIYLSDLYICPEFRRMGIARAFLNHIVQGAKQANCGRAYWVTEHDNPARSLYDEVGKPEFIRYHVDF